MNTDYKKEQEQLLNILDNLPYIHDEQVELSEMKAFNDITNLYGRFGSKSFLKYKKYSRMLQSFNRGQGKATFRWRKFT